MSNYQTKWRSFFLKEAILTKYADIIDKTLAKKGKLEYLCKKLRDLHWPEEMIKYHSEHTTPFSELREVIWYIQDYLAPEKLTINSHEIDMLDFVLQDREKKYNMYLDGEIDKYFWNDPKDPRIIEKKYLDGDIEDLMPITVIYLEDQELYDPLDGGHRIYLAHKNKANMPAWIIPKTVNGNRTFETHMIKKMFGN